ncbi:MAG: hypothetical protein HFACDABA_01226 [Anaerolineales bacterium]|nr:hypothetical protein [Anaerolineales bacterium]
MFIDPLSFGIGFITALLLAFIYGRMQPALQEARAGWRARREENAAKRASGVEDNHRRITLRRAQGMHLAAPLFALDEILIPPKLTAPPPRLEPDAPFPREDIVSQTLPYLPAWPELAALYNAPALSLAQALSGGSNIVILGAGGAGKTVTLAHLASLCANKDARLGSLSESVPVLIHAADLNLPVTETKEALNPIINITSEHMPLFDQGRMPAFLQYAFRQGNALLLLDGFDELAPDAQKQVADYLKTLLAAYPKARIVTTAIPEQMDGLLALDFAPLALAGWNAAQQQDFVRTWGRLWTRFVSTEAWAQTSEQSVDPFLIETWLNAGGAWLTPLELTLKTWGAFAGDSLGPDALDSISAHLRRLAPPGTPPAALETLALQAIVNSQMIFDPRKAREWVKAFDAIEEKPAEAAVEGEKSKTGPLGQKKTLQTASYGLLSKMNESGLLVSHPNYHMRFSHPVLGGYLAGRGLTGIQAEDHLLSQPNWSGKLLALHYFAAQGDATKLVEKTLAQEDPLLQRPLLMAARWLRDAPRDAAWRGRIMAGLARVLQTEEYPRGLRSQAMAGLVLSGDPGASALFRQSMQSLSFELICLAALGCGAIQDPRSVELLASSLSAPSAATRRAASLALVALGSAPALEAVARGLLQGDDDVRRAAAEALANHPKDGHETLRDGATLPDIQVRRATVYGLARVEEPWAVEILQSLQVNDSQWIVKTAATEALEARSNPADPRVPRPLTPPSQTPWLLEFAGKEGVGIPPGSPATEVLLKALKSGNEAERGGALTYLRRTPTEGVVREIYGVLQSDDADLREAAYQFIWELGSSGAALPPPKQYGFG